MNLNLQITLYENSDIYHINFGLTIIDQLPFFAQPVIQ